jgi:primase-polymerase (primpol)-like protein
MMPGPLFAERHTNIPIAMKEWDHWCCWQYVQRNGKKTKQPFDPKTGLHARTNNSATWGSYDQAIAASAKFDGIGLVLTNSHFAAFDIDNCRNPETGDIDPETLRFAKYVNSHTEITPSGTGLRIIGIGNGEEIHRSRRLNETVKIETYRRATRFITVTGDRFPGSPSTLFEIDCAVDATVNYLDSIRARNGIEHIEKATTDAYTILFRILAHSKRRHCHKKYWSELRIIPETRAKACTALLGN